METQALTRRSALSTIGAAGVAVSVPAVAVATDHPDAALLALGKELDVAIERYNVSLTAWQPLWALHRDRMAEWKRRHPFADDSAVYLAGLKQLEKEAGHEHPDHVLNDPHVDSVLRAVMETPATTAAGLAVKARQAAFAASHFWDKADEDADWDKLCVRKLIEAVLAVGRAS